MELQDLNGLSFALTVIIGVILLFGMFGNGSSGLEVSQTDFISGDKHAIIVTNVGSKPVTITNITFNDRSDCHAFRIDADMFNPHAAPTFPMELKVGDRKIISAGCGIVRTTITTADGQYSYSFTR